MQYISILYQWELRAWKLIHGMLLNISAPCLASWLDAMRHRLQSHAQQLLRAILSDPGVCSLLSPLAKIPCIEGSTALITVEAWQHVPTHAVHASFGR